MLTEDYIMRMINQALAIFMIALGLKKTRQFEESIKSFDQALESLLGLNAHLVKQLDDNLLLEMLTFQGRLDIDRLVVLADIYHEESDVYTSLGQHENSNFAEQRSLRLYLEAALATGNEPNLELIQKIEEIRNKLPSHTLPVVTRLALLDYFDRLLAFSDDDLVSAGFSRPDLLIAYSSLDSPELH